MGASSSALAVETLGFTRNVADRNTTIDVASDANAYLGVTEDGVDAGGQLFEGGIRSSPATFEVVNQLPEPISLTLESERFWFKTTDGTATSDGRRLVVDDEAGDTLEPGQRLAGIAVWPRSSAIKSAFGSTVSGTIRIAADGEGSRIDAERDLSLEPPGVSAEWALLEMSQRGGGVFEHRWKLTDVETTTDGTETFRFDYSGLETSGAIDFTESDSLTVSITVDGVDRAGSIENRGVNRLTVTADEPLAADGDTVEIVLTGTGGPASPGGKPWGPTGATVELLDAGFRTRIEALRSHPRT